MSSILLLLFIALLIAGLFIQRAEIGRLEGEAGVLRAERQSIANLRERADDATALEKEKRDIIRIAAEQAERLRVLEFAGNNLATAACKAASSLPDRASGLACDVYDASTAWEKAREGRN